MACGTPTIVSNVSSLPEVVGTLPCWSTRVTPRRLPLPMHRLLTDDDLHAEMSEKGLQRAHTFSWEKQPAVRWRSTGRWSPPARPH